MPSCTAKSSLHCCAGNHVTTNRSTHIQQASSTVIRVTGPTFMVLACVIARHTRHLTRSATDRSVHVLRLSACHACNMWRTHRNGSAAVSAHAGPTLLSIRHNKLQGATLRCPPQSRPFFNATRLKRFHGTQFFEKDAAPQVWLCKKITAAVGK